MTNTQKSKYLRYITKNDILLFLSEDIGRSSLKDYQDFKNNLEIVETNEKSILCTTKIPNRAAKINIICEDFKCSFRAYSPTTRTDKTYTVEFVKFVYDKLKDKSPALAEKYKKDYEKHILNSNQDKLSK